MSSDWEQPYVDALVQGRALETLSQRQLVALLEACFGAVAAQRVLERLLRGGDHRRSVLRRVYRCRWCARRYAHTDAVLKHCKKHHRWEVASVKRGKPERYCWPEGVAAEEGGGGPSPAGPGPA